MAAQDDSKQPTETVDTVPKAKNDSPLANTTTPLQTMYVLTKSPTEIFA